MRVQSGVGQGCGLTWGLAWAGGPFPSDTLLHGLAAASKARYPREKGSSHEGLYSARSHTPTPLPHFSVTQTYLIHQGRKCRKAESRLQGSWPPWRQLLACCNTRVYTQWLPDRSSVGTGPFSLAQEPQALGWVQVLGSLVE